jgi:SAM-dependent methyltransferase
MMLRLESASSLPTATGTKARSAPVDEPGALARSFASLGIENRDQWAWDNYKGVVEKLCRLHKAHSIVEIGGGRYPLFDRAEINDLGVNMTINDISPNELAALPAGYRAACFDVAGDLTAIKHLCGSFDLAFSRMVFEHVVDGQRAWSNLYQLLAPGGVALAFIPTLYSLPFVVNWLLPDGLTGMIIKRTRPANSVFPAH